jgi:hemophore-related protein
VDADARGTRRKLGRRREDHLRGYFTANPQDYYDLRGILAPIDDAQRQCNVTVPPSDLASAY